jgi:uncharacterized membrane protein
LRAGSAGAGEAAPAQRWLPRHGQSRGSGRLEAFSDAVIAIMLTMLSLQLIELDPHAIERAGLGQALLGQWPTFFAFAITFLVVDQIWITHHNMWRYIARVDQSMLIINLALLLSIVVIPVAARLLAQGITSLDSPDGRLAAGL